MKQNLPIVEVSKELTVNPVLAVKIEPDYMSRGHFFRGTKAYIDERKVWGLPIGTRLYTEEQLMDVLNATKTGAKIIFGHGGGTGC